MDAIVTTIIPTCNRAVMLRRAIRSALNQTIGNVVVLVLDNASDDETPTVVADIARSDQRLIYFRHNHRISAEDNFQSGLNMVGTPFFSFLSDDDILLPDFYSRAHTSIGSYPDAMFVAGLTLIATATAVVGISGALRYRQGYYSTDIGLDEWIKNEQITWTGILFRSEVRAAVGPLDQNCKCGDIDYQLRVVSKFPYVVIHDPVAMFTMHGENTSTNNCLWPSVLDVVRKFESSPSHDKERKRSQANSLRKSYVRGLLRDYMHATRLGNERSRRENEFELKTEYSMLWKPIIYRVAGLMLRVPGAYRIGRHLLQRDQDDLTRQYEEWFRYYLSLADVSP